MVRKTNRLMHGLCGTASVLLLSTGLAVIYCDRSLADCFHATPWPLDYIIISHTMFSPSPEAALGRLLALKRNQGFSYRHFQIGDGVHRDSVKSIIRTLYDSTDYSPLYVLLIGSARSGGSEAVSSAANGNFIPAYYQMDAFGDHWTAYDQWYGWLSSYDLGSKKSRVIVGRIPARTEAQLQAYVDKLQAYWDNGDDDAWKRRAVLVAGDEYRGEFPSKPPAVVVREDIDALRDSLPQGMTCSIVRYSDYSSTAAREQAFSDSVNAGTGIIAALSTWSDADNFGHFLARPSFDAATDLSNSGKYPIFLASSCRLGKFDVKDYNVNATLIENLLFTPSRGVIAIVGPAGWSSDVCNPPFLQECMRLLFCRGMRRLGNLVLAAVINLKEYGLGLNDTYEMETVLGDPGLDIDLGNVTDSQEGFSTSLERTDAVPLQSWWDQTCTPAGGIRNARAGVVKSNIILGQRSYRVAGNVGGAGRSPAYNWTLQKGVGVVLGPQTRFLTYRAKATRHCDAAGAKVGVDLRLRPADGDTLLGESSIPTSIVDQYGVRLATAYRAVPLGVDRFYAFDLKGEDGEGMAYGRIINDVVICHRASNPNCDTFNVTFDEIALSPTWGSSPEVGPIEMATNMYKNTTHNASISSYDRDVVADGDRLSAQWSATKGYFAPDTGFNVVYHAPNDTATAVVTAVVSDKGGHSDSSTKTIVVINYVPPTCPHLFVWDGREYLDQGAVLTRSRFDAGAVLRDARPVLTRPVPTGGMIRLALREEGNDSATLDRVAMTFVKVDSVPEGRIGIGAGGRVLKAVRPIAPVYCSDDHQFHQLDKVVARDSVSFSAFGPGYLYVGYENLRPVGQPKLGGEWADDGGGPDLEDPPKNQYKIAVPPPEPKEPNYVSVSILTPKWEWQEIARLAPESKAGLPELIDLLPYVDASGALWVKIAWTWSFSADDLCFYQFSDSGITEREVALSGARHNLSGSVMQSLSGEDEQKVTLSPGQEIVLDFPAVSPDLYDFAVMRFWGRYDPVGKGGQSVSGPSAPIPTEVRLAQNFPNPFNAGTVINYDLPDDGPVTLEVFDILGRRVATLIDHEEVAGQHMVSWDGRDDRGNAVASGVYFYRLSAQGVAQSKKMILIK